MGLSTSEGVALSREVDASSSLLRHGFGILKDYRFATTDAEALFTCFAGGAEKLLKLTFGLITLDEGGAWPKQATMRGAGHKIVELDATVRDLLVKRQARSTAPGLLAGLLGLADRHQGVVQILVTLERYAVDGRFYNLDLLGRRVQEDAPPAELWHELEMTIFDANPEMLDEAATELHEAVRSDMNSIIAYSMGIWCELIARSWITGVCGDEAARWSAQLDLGHPAPKVRL